MSYKFLGVQLLACMLLILFIFSFTAHGFTTYDRTRHYVGDLAAQPEDDAGLRVQYDDMAKFFSGSSGDTYTFFFRSSPVDVTRAQVEGKDRDAVISTVLDNYADLFYHDKLGQDGPGEASIFMDATGNLLYAAIAIITAIGLIATLCWMLLGFPEISLPCKAKGIGIALALASVCAFVIFALLPGILRSLFWSSIVSGGADDAWNMVEPAASGALLQNALIALVLFAILFAIGYLWAGKGGTAKTSTKSER